MDCGDSAVRVSAAGAAPPAAEGLPVGCLLMGASCPRLGRRDQAGSGPVVARRAASRESMLSGTSLPASFAAETAPAIALTVYSSTTPWLVAACAVMLDCCCAYAAFWNAMA